MFVYFVVVILIVFGAMLGYVQQVSDEAAWGYWAVPIGLLIIACIHVASYVGQRLATAQMYELRGRLEWVVARQFGAGPEVRELFGATGAPTVILPDRAPDCRPG